MLLIPAVEADYAAIVDLANVAYRGGSDIESWNAESGILEGQRLTDCLLREDIAAKPDACLLTYREYPEGVLLGTVWLDPRHDSERASKRESSWYLSLLMVRPNVQNQQLGRSLLAAAEEFILQRGGHRVEMSVIHVRQTLIAWYLRRGYRLTGETQPFPYGDERFGRPLRDDLYFVILTKDL